MSCIEITLVLLSISICRPDTSIRRLPGAWVGTLESRGELKVIRAEFVRGRSGLTGAVHLEGEGELALLRAVESGSGVYLETRDDDFVFVGSFREDSIAGRVHHAGEQFPFELRRMPGTRSRNTPAQRQATNGRSG